MEILQMNNLLIKLLVKFQDLVSREEGQDLVEYALVVALIAFGMGALAGGINKAFNTISTTLSTTITTILF